MDLPWSANAGARYIDRFGWPKSPKQLSGIGSSVPTISSPACQVLAWQRKVFRPEQIVARADDEGVVIGWRDAAGETHQRAFEKVLVAAGRRPNLEGLRLESTGIALDERGRPSWDPTTTQCGTAPIFMAGDVSGHPPLLHEAADEGHIAGANAATYPRVTSHVRREPLAVAFTAPQMAIVGVPYARLQRDAIETGEVSFDDQGRARVMGQNSGLLRLYARREGCTLLGGEMFGPRVEHMAHLLAWAVQEKMTVMRALKMPIYHPVVEEGLRTGLRDLAGRLKVTGRCRREDFAEVPGIARLYSILQLDTVDGLLSTVARVTFTSNLQRHLDCPPAEMPGGTVREVLDGYFAKWPRARRYILDDQNGVQRHVVVFVGDHPVSDRQGLSDLVGEGQTIFVFQALSGG